MGQRRRRAPQAAAVCLAILAAAASVLPAADAHTRSLLASSGSPAAMSCGYKAKPTDEQQAAQADLELFNARMAAAAGNGSANTRVAAKAITVPVYFHVLRANSKVSGGNVPRKWVSAQIAVLNKYFAKVGFKFVLTKVTYTTNSKWFRMGPGTYTELAAKKKLKRGSLKTLNVYSGKYDDTLGGWAYSPDDLAYLPSTVDGTVIAWDTLPGSKLKNYNTGKTLVHEVGHWMGLLHTFQPSYSSSGRNLGGCVGPGDFVSDTPAERSPNFGGCSKRRNTCKSAKGDDPIKNFMDYSIDGCRNTFSKGQVSRMKSMYNRYRASGTGYGNQGSNNDGLRRAGSTSAPAGGVPAGCAGCKCYPREGYCICSCDDGPRAVPAA